MYLVLVLTSVRNFIGLMILISGSRAQAGDRVALGKFNFFLTFLYYFSFYY